ncbi:hypothetical protein LWF15_11200 [Kineosporia rhizophila]|uniref:hypothetical protein n=1 Tax=Kineosporia rhizophila TaxID=84633 RepID=UPI001E326CDA|nr:hypothetical protein [Kineosporia rhizophila]MCE0536077.1 hypothetical protein [Kineosporia rhizophila]
MSELAGRPVYTRADLVALHGVSLSSLETWYRERAETGHPEAVGKVGRSLAWDTHEWDTWYADWIDTTGLAAIDTLTELVARSRSTLARLWDERDANGHPLLRKKIGNVQYWDADEYVRWFRHYEQGADDARRSRVDRSGRPDDQLTLAEFARVLGIPPNTATTYARRPPAGWPEPVIAEELPSGRFRRRYTRQQAWDYARDYLGRRHPGGGRPSGPVVSRSHPYQADPRLALAQDALSSASADERGRLAKRLADEHGGAPGTWARIITAARHHPVGAGQEDASEA